MVHWGGEAPGDWGPHEASDGGGGGRVGKTRTRDTAAGSRVAVAERFLEPRFGCYPKDVYIFELCVVNLATWAASGEGGGCG